MALLALIVAFPLNAQNENVASEPLYWFWSPDCEAFDLRLLISFDESRSYEWTVPLCHGTWKDRERASNKIRIEKSLVVSRPIVWSGYTDDVQISPAGDNIEANIWLAGAESDGMIIGVTFFSEKLRGILMNTVFYASVDAESSVEIAPGLMVRSIPTGNRFGVDPRESWVPPNDTNP